ncbi:MAG: monothiol glutaredoxin, Grx4 family [Gammaproteobacteria bacterium RIFCSPHIGHO2_12_FULL_45_9]|nr:MAG: monothiol glutaredoxin, Grx4 family [Gammaproteobacteria bacterium RIFCSPHIGHO2_12_FULL_45_9]
MSEIHAKIQQQIEQNPVILYMKGTKDFPACGFSARVVQILHDLQVPFTDVDILEDAELRQAIKEYTNWPTLPQLYIKGEFIGGCDIVTEMYKSGELKAKLQAAGFCPVDTL